LKLNLRVWDSSDNQYYLDLFEDDPVNITRQFSDAQLNKPSGSFSQTFRLPATENNAAFFSNFHDVNSVGDFNPKVKSTAELEANSIPIIRGFLQLKAVYIENRQPEYEVTLFGETANLFREIGDKKLSELDLSAFDHELTYTNINSSTQGGGNLFDGDIRYGLIDKGRGWALDGTGRPINSELPIYEGDWTPFIRVKAIVDQIFADAGFSYASDFFGSSYVENLYMPLFNGKLFPIATESPETIGFNVGLSALENVTTSQGFYQFTGLSDTGNFFDGGSDYTIGADDYWTAPYTGIFTFRAWVSGFNDFAFEDELQISFTRNGFTYLGLPTITVDGDSNFNYVSNTITMDLEQGDEIRFGVRFQSSNANRDIDFNGGSSPDLENGTGWQLLSATAPYSGVDLDIAANCPDIKQKDFLSGLQKMFNLVFVPDKNNPLQLTIEPYQSYVYSGDVLDWTEKIDYSKTVSVKPTSDIQKREYVWKYKEGKDILNQYFVNNSPDEMYGELELEDTENDFATGTEEVEVPFAAYPCAYIAGSNIVIAKLFDESGTTIQDPLPRIAYYGGLEDCLTLTVSNAGTNTTRDTYPFFGHYSTPIAGVDAEDLNFNVETPLHIIDAQPTNNLYNKYWRDYVNEYYSVEARKMTAFFNIDLADYYSLGFDDRIFIKDSYWRVLKINQFQPNKEELTEVELIKELRTPRACEFLPTGNTNNQITFTNEAGTSGLDGSQECCELFGYQWSSAQSKCFATQVPTGGLNPTSPQFRANTRERSLSVGINTFGDGTIESVVAGAGINTGENNSYSTMIGRNLDSVDDLGSIQVFGDDAYGWSKGLHLGNGSFGELGSKQSGRVVLSGSGDFDSSDIVDLAPTLTIPSNTAIAMRLKVLISEYNIASGQVEYAHTLEATAVVRNDTALTIDGFDILHDETGDFGTGHIDIETTISGDDLTIRVENVNANNGTNPVQIVASLDYVMTRH